MGDQPASGAPASTAPHATTSHKRDQVQKAQRTMFFWVAGMSAVVGFALVIAWFLWQQLVFRTEVVNQKNETVATLEKNNEALPELKNNLRVLEVNSALQSAKANQDEQALQVILDALPSEKSSLALGSSLQEKLVGDSANVTIETLSTDTDSISNVTADNAVPFRLVVTSSDAGALKNLLQKFERSIRVIDIDALTLERSTDRYTLTLTAHAYYEPARVIELQKTTVKPKG